MKNEHWPDRYLSVSLLREHILPCDFHGQSHLNIKCEFQKTCKEQIGSDYKDIYAVGFKPIIKLTEY